MSRTPGKRLVKSIPANQCHLYGIRSIHALANRLGWELDKLENIAMDGGYRVYPHRKTGRIIQEPSAALQSLHRNMHKYLSRITVPDYLHSAVKGRSYLTNARSHVNGDALIKIDIKKFYASVPQHKVMQFFRDNLGCAADVAGLLANLICFNGKLATGSAVSPIISYYAFKETFDQIEILAIQYGLKMTCYVDDVTLSGKKASAFVLHEVRTIIYRSGLKAHKEKYFPSGSPKLVTGVVATGKGIRLPFSRWKKIRQQLRELAACNHDEQRLAIYPILISRLYEAAQIEMRCRSMAELYHAEWRILKSCETPF